MGQKEIGAELRQDWELKEVQTGNVDLILKTNKQTTFVTVPKLTEWRDRHTGQRRVTDFFLMVILKVYLLGQKGI